MNLDDLHRAWAAHLNADGAASARVSPWGAPLRRAERTLRANRVRLAFEIAVQVLAIVVLFAIFDRKIASTDDAARQLRIAVPIALLWAGAIATLVATVREARLARSVDHDDSIAAVQERLLRLRLARVRRLRRTMWLAPLAWTPLAIVALRAFDVDAYALGTNVILANVVASVALPGACYAVGRAFPRFFEDRDMSAALDALAEMRAFVDDRAAT